MSAPAHTGHSEDRREWSFVSHHPRLAAMALNTFARCHAGTNKAGSKATPDIQPLPIGEASQSSMRLPHLQPYRKLL